MISGSTSKRSAILPGVALAGLCALVLAACGSDDGAGNPDSELSTEQATAPLEGAPPQLAAIREQANELLDGGTEAFDQRLAELQGTPVVVNKWASWCGPCRLEFPFFQSQADQRGAEVAFLGVALRRLRGRGRHLPRRSCRCPTPPTSTPTRTSRPRSRRPRTSPRPRFYDASGELVYTHQGGYADEEELAADIDRYAR